MFVDKEQYHIRIQYQKEDGFYTSEDLHEDIPCCKLKGDCEDKVIPFILDKYKHLKNLKIIKISYI